MAYNPLELAAYLRRARHPTEGFTPSFTNVDGAGPYDFDVRSAEEMLPPEEEEEEEIDPISQVLTSLPNVEDLTTPESVLAATTATELEMDKLVRQKQRATEQQFGVPQAREFYQTFAAVGGISPDNPLFLRAKQDLESKIAAANMAFGVVEDNTLVGTEADAFRPFEARLQKLDDRFKVLTKQEEEQRVLDREERQLDAQLGREKRISKSKQQDLLQKALISKGIDSDTFEYIKSVEGEELRAEDVTALSPEVISLYERASNGYEITDPASWASKDPDTIEVYNKILDQDETIPEEDKKAIKQVNDEYQAVADEIAQRPDSSFFEKLEWEKTLSLTNDKREEAIKAARQKASAQAIREKAAELKGNFMTFSNMSLENDPNHPTREQVASKIIVDLMKEEFGSDLLTIVDQNPSAIAAVASRYRDTMPYKSGLPFNDILDAMIDRLVANVNRQGSKFGFAVSPKDDPLITKLQAFKVYSSPGLFGRLF